MAAGLKFLFNIIVRRGNLTIIDAAGAAHNFGDGTGKQVQIRLASKAVERKLTFNPSFYLGETYMDGGLIVEHGSLRDLLELLLVNLRRRWPTSLKFLEYFRTLSRRFHQYNPASRAKRNVAHHYNLDGALYELFLDKGRHYSCAYYENPNATLEEAQSAKLRHIAAKLDLRDGHNVLDIGSGWGGLGIYLASLGKISVTGLTLSEEQLAQSRLNADAAGLSSSVEFVLEDYRQFDARKKVRKFDRIVSVGMFEHVGVSHYEEYFSVLADNLAEDGVALLHSIGRFDGPGSTNPWLAKYIFPGGYAPALSEVIPIIERQGLYITDIEILRHHYAQTLQAWQTRFQANRAQAAALYDERFCRMWEFYLAASEMSFLHQDLMVFQIQISNSPNTLPITRDYMSKWESEQRRSEIPKSESAAKTLK